MLIFGGVTFLKSFRYFPLVQKDFVLSILKIKTYDILNIMRLVGTFLSYHNFWWISIQEFVLNYFFFNYENFEPS